VGTTARRLLRQARQNGVSTTLKIYSPQFHRAMHRNPGSQARVTKAIYESRVTDHESRTFDEL
jgi:hypothetical protein